MQIGETTTMIVKKNLETPFPCLLKPKLEIFQYFFGTLKLQGSKGYIALLV